MKVDILKTYVLLRQKLTNEKAQLEQRLQKINQALGEVSTVAGSATPAAPVGRPKKRFLNEISLPKAVVQVTSGNPMTKEEILVAVQKLGYRFLAKEPMKSLLPILYSKKLKFLRQDGKFSPASGMGGKVATARSAKKAVKPKRTMSPAARARLSAIARARWKKTKAQGKTRL